METLRGSDGLEWGIIFYMSEVDKIKAALSEVGTEEKAKASAWFFKTAPGQYGFGDKFIGVTLPEQRAIAKKYLNIRLSDIEILLASSIHEERMTALLILVDQFKMSLRVSPPMEEAKRGNLDQCKEIFDFYISHTKGINNWDLVDVSADKIVGGYFLTKDDPVSDAIVFLSKLAKSDNLWERRIAMVATFQFLKEKKSNMPTFEIADILISDRNDLIQKAVGWMLRESGKRISTEMLDEYLVKNYKEMGRTALRYSIEHFDASRKQQFMLGSI